ncbi:hypothetical protein Bca52824_035491 [Brassica carinata]|uniref:Uncharacterized protein n=1 Tax=Brassica carinata TaxID=52824 RepID=A0A8X7S7N3_BRACI|nr:hypothetical protein Bca52824_035491 [Brassica carinata]
MVNLRIERECVKDVSSSSASTKYGGVQKLESVTNAEFNAYVLSHRSGTQPVQLYPLKPV